MINNIFRFLIEADQKFGANIGNFLQKYSFPKSNAVFEQSNMVFLSKVSAYSLFLILPFSVLKILRPENSMISFLFALSLIAFASSIFGIFLGFFQQLFI